MTAVPRVVIAAPSSGHGKTALTIGLLAAYTQRWLHAAGFKIGPDFIDAAYLGLAAGCPTRNLDPRLTGSARVAPLFAHGARGADVAVIEGTMGLYDGLSGGTDVESTAHVAGLLRAPVVLLIDVAAMGQSVAALVHGFRAYDELLWLGGVILNRVASDAHERVLREALSDIAVPVLGVFRHRMLSLVGMPSRSQGVVPVAHGSIEASRAVRRLAEVVSGAVDLERLLALARAAPALSGQPWSPADAVGDRAPEITRTAHVPGSQRPGSQDPGSLGPASQAAGRRAPGPQLSTSQLTSSQVTGAPVTGPAGVAVPASGTVAAETTRVPDAAPSSRPPAAGAGEPGTGDDDRGDAGPGTRVGIDAVDPDDTPASGIPAASATAGGPLAGSQLDRQSPIGVALERHRSTRLVAHAPLIAVAGTTACLYSYPETAELLTAAGAEVVIVDPLRDRDLPEGTAGLVIGGALPEEYAEELAANAPLIRAVGALAAAHRPIVAERTGLAWLAREYDERPMCGVLDAAGRTGDHLVLGYREATMRSVSPLLPPGTRVVGFKHHRGLVSPRAGTHPAWSWPGGAPEGFVSDGVLASYLCLHWAGIPEIASSVVALAGDQTVLGMAS